MRGSSPRMTAESGDPLDKPHAARASIAALSSAS
jgi:hypothetical protein